MSVAVVVDSAAALPGDLVARHRITVVPMHVMVGDLDRYDRDVPLAELLEVLDRGVTTSGPNAGEFTAAVEDALGRADEVVVLTVASGMSSTFGAAQLGAGASSAPGRVRVVDTRTAAGGEALVALAAARAAAGGADADAVVEVAADVIARVHLVATLDDLTHLARSGRVPEAAGAAANKLHVNPLFEFKDGHASPKRPALSPGAALHRIVHTCEASRPHDGGPHRLHAAVLHADAEERARRLLDEVRGSVPDADVFLGPFGPVMVVHTGPGLVGLAWWWDG